MKRTIATFVALTALALSASPAAAKGTTGKKPIKLENLMRRQLARVDGTEVIVSRVTLAPNAVLPTHWHPGEEFAYILDGSVTLFQKGKKAIEGSAGEVVQIPLEQIHSAKAGKSGALVLVFRVHEQGKPERVIVK